MKFNPIKLLQSVATLIPATWQTRIFGAATMLGAISLALKAVFDGDPATEVNWEVTIGGFWLGWGMMLTRPNTVTSEQVIETAPAKVAAKMEKSME